MLLDEDVGWLFAVIMGVLGKGSLGGMNEMIVAFSFINVSYVCAEINETNTTDNDLFVPLQHTYVPKRWQTIKMK